MELGNTSLQESRPQGGPSNTVPIPALSPAGRDVMSTDQAQTHSMGAVLEDSSRNTRTSPRNLSHTAHHPDSDRESADEQTTVIQHVKGLEGDTKLTNKTGEASDEQGTLTPNGTGIQGDRKLTDKTGEASDEQGTLTPNGTGIQGDRKLTHKTGEASDEQGTLTPNGTGMKGERNLVDKIGDAEKQDDKEEDGEGGKAEGEGREGGGGRGGWVGERVGCMVLFGVPIVTLHVQGQERLCLAQISSSLLHEFSYNEIHNRRVALGITCLQCTPSQLEVLRRAGAMPVTSRRCGLITRREAERLVRSFIADVRPPRLPDNFTFRVRHQCGWGNEGVFVPARYNSSRAKCIRCVTCHVYFSPNKFIFHFHPSPTPPSSTSSTYRHPDAANFNSWRRHLELVHAGPDDERLLHAWEDVKAMFNGGCRRRVAMPSHSSSSPTTSLSSSADGAVRYQGSHLGRGVLEQRALPHTARNGGSASLSRAGHGGTKGGADVPSMSAYTAWTPPQHTASFPPAPLSLLPLPASANAHPAFFAASGHVMSYGDYLRSMSRPYNVSHLPPPSSTLPLDCYRDQSGSFLPAMLATNPYPLSYFGYPPFFGAAQSDGKGGSPAYFQPQLFPFSGCTSQQADDAGSREMVDSYQQEKTSEQPERSSLQTTEDNWSMDEYDEEEEEEELNQTAPDESMAAMITSPTHGASHSARHDAVTDSKNKNDDDGGQATGDAWCAVTIDESQDDTTHDWSRRDEGGRVEGEDDDNTYDKENERTGHSTARAVSHKDQTPKTPLLSHDAASLLEAFEDTCPEDVDIFIQLPIYMLRRLCKLSRKKSQEVDKELTKLKEVQRLQRLRAEEVKEELSRQFFAIKEMLWSDIEQERKMSTALRDRLAEVQNLAPQALDSSYNLFNNMK
ncbi:uncharacterized protein [Littorina saxatilis]|uniref:uncharacterized protein n=1 Tax=Littorina saxatilis TaxID=31220 RepID=UPI0038B58D05